MAAVSGRAIKSSLMMTMVTQQAGFSCPGIAKPVLGRPRSADEIEEASQIGERFWGTGWKSIPRHELFR
jgi:hypothetical protein